MEKKHRGCRGERKVASEIPGIPLHTICIHLVSRPGTCSSDPPPPLFTFHKGALGPTASSVHMNRESELADLFRSPTRVHIAMHPVLSDYAHTHSKMPEC